MCVNIGMQYFINFNTALQEIGIKMNMLGRVLEEQAWMALLIFKCYIGIKFSELSNNCER